MGKYNPSYKAVDRNIGKVSIGEQRKRKNKAGSSMS
jgi:hypothetical protein